MGPGCGLKFPAFVQQERCWILPAFSPWAGRRQLAGRRREPHLALHAGASVAAIDVSLRECRKSARPGYPPARVVQCGQRVALIGIVIVQAGQSFVTRPARPGAGVFILLSALHNKENAERDDDEVDHEGDKVAVVPGDRAGFHGVAVAKIATAGSVLVGQEYLLLKNRGRRSAKPIGGMRISFTSEVTIPRRPRR